MKNNSKKCKLKYLFIILLISSLLVLFLIIQNKISSIQSIINTNFIKYKNIIRNIEENDDDDEDEYDYSSFNSEVKDKCDKASDDIQDYFKKYDESLMEINSLSLKEIEIYPEYVEALLDILEKDGKLMDNLSKYMNHAFAAMFFLVLGIIAIVCWLCFGFFCCCNCCCCCCCKKPECKGKILFFSLLFDSIIIITCLIGLITSNTMFNSFEDVECTFMKFISEINSGEHRPDGTGWVGFNEIISTFKNIKSKVEEIKTDNKPELDEAYGNHTQAEENFKNSLEVTYGELLDPDDPYSDIIFPVDLCFRMIQQDTTNLLDVGALDVLYNYGPVTNDEKFLYQLDEQYNTITEKANKYLNSSFYSLKHIFKENSIDIFVDEIISNIKDLRKSVNVIKDKFETYIIKYFDIVGESGNYMVKICYIAVICLSCLSMISLITMYSTAEECCYQRFCFGKGLTKTLSHVSWNLMSIVMILSFFICGVIFLISSVGKDLVEVISVILGQQNLFSRKPILIDGSASKYLNVCLHGDGDLPEILGLYSGESALFEFDELNKIINNVEEAKSDLETVETVIRDYRAQIEKRQNLEEIEFYDFNTSVFLNVNEMINEFNELISLDEYDMWTLSETCQDTDYIYIDCPEDESTIERKDLSQEEETPKECLNFQKWKTGYKKRYGPPAVLVLGIVYNTVLKAADYYVSVINNVINNIKDSDALTTLVEKIDVIKSTYYGAINAKLDALDKYNKTIYKMLSIFSYMGDETKSLYSFLRCEFIRNNILIVFKYLETAFGGKVQSFGVTFVFASFAMFFAIFFTILEIVILNISLYIQKRRRQRDEELRKSLGGEKLTTYETTTTEKNRIKRRKSKNAY